MGIKNLKKILKNHNLIKQIKLDDIRGKQIAIDLSLTIYQLISIGSTRNIQHDGKNTHHIQGIFYKTAKLLLQNITPVYFFDGAPPAEKDNTLAKRRETRTLKVPKSAFGEVLEILNLFGVECVMSPGEAEAQAARYVQDGLLFAVMTEDTDVIPLNAKMILQDKNKFYMIDPSEVYAALKMTREQFVDFCILLGCDYSATLPGIGPVTAEKYILKYLTIENILESGVKKPDSFDYAGARRNLLYPLVNADSKLLGRTPISYDALRERLIYYGMSAERIDKTLNLLKKI